MQKAFKASYPTGNSKEEWIIINEISQSLESKNLFNNKDQLIDNMLNYLNLNLKENKDIFEKSVKGKFFDEKVITVPIDYYYSNVIARASKTMSECRNLKIDFQKTGTEG